MTVVEVCVGRKMINPPDDPLQLNSSVLSLLHEGVAQNSTGNVFVAKVNFHAAQTTFFLIILACPGKPLDCLSEVMGLRQFLFLYFSVYNFELSRERMSLCFIFHFSFVIGGSSVTCLLHSVID